jgi:hypothetical protein
VDRVTNESAESIAEIIHDDTGLPAEESELIAVSLVGMAQVSARYWLAKEGRIPQDEAANLVSGLAWRGIRGFPRTDEQPA